VDAIGLTRIDVLGHSMGGLVAQQIALDRPELVRKVILVGTGPRGGEEIGSRPAWVGELFTRRYPRQEDMWIPILFSPSEAGVAAGRAYVERILERPDRDTPVSQQSVSAQRDAIAAYGGAKDPEFPELRALTQPVLVVNGNDDIIIPTVNSYLLQQHLPNAQLLLFPDSGHGAHHQYHDQFAHHARYFLDHA
jgi:pimeloyl-ACP methyl ester carboxylesterase